MGLLVYAVDALMVSVAVLESVPLACSARAIAAVNGAGSVGQMLSPLLVTWFARHYGWDNLFNLFLITSLIAAAIVARAGMMMPQNWPQSAPSRAKSE
jgi:sugar phosphate permease